MSEYFPHDYNARNDAKLQALTMDMGLEGIGLYWCIVEQMYEAGGTLPLASMNSIAYANRVDLAKVQMAVFDYDLFNNDGNEFWSESLNRRMAWRAADEEYRKEQKRILGEKRRKAANKRWHKNEPAKAEPVIIEPPIVMPKAKQSEADYISSLQTDQIFLEYVARAAHCTIVQAISIVIEFGKWVELNGDEHRNLADARRHLSCWLLSPMGRAAALSIQPLEARKAKLFGEVKVFVESGAVSRDIAVAFCNKYTQMSNTKAGLMAFEAAENWSTRNQLIKFTESWH